VGLDPQVVSKYPYEFSGGQRQRIGIARVMILAPKLVIADEPVSALDVSVQAQVLNLLKTLQGDTGFSMLFISHDLGVVRHVADRVAVMYLGQVVELAPTEEIFNNPNHPYTRLLLDSIPRINPAQHNTAPTKQAEPLSPMQVHPGCSFVNRCTYAQPQCENRPPPLVELSVSHQSRCHLASELYMEAV
jgi:oligopeptide/dipeptide ABC transporter ATP-binding protein